ncbi:MAG: ATP-binding protein [Pseudomonadota bacterium]
MTKRYSFNLSSLQKRLLIYVVIPMIVLSGGAISFGLQIAADQEEQRLKADLELLGRAISLPLSDALMSGNLNAVQANLDSVFSIGRVYGASVYNVQGEQVAEAGITETDLSNSFLAQQTVETGITQDDYRKVEGKDVFSQFLPIIDRGGRIIGLLQINRKASDFEDRFAQLSQVAWISWAIFALVTIAVLIFGHYRGVGRHVVELKNAMRRVAEGDRDSRVKPGGPSEIAEISEGLNRMLDSIAEAEKELQLTRQQEAKLQQALREQEKMAAIGSVASGVAHELGAPLTVIDARARRLLKEQTNDKDRRQLTAVRGQVQRLTGLVNQLLAFSRTPVQERRLISATTLIQRAIENLNYEREDDTIAITTHDIAPLKLNVDEKRLELALINVLRNALQAATEQVTVTVKRQREFAEFIICDDGEGIKSTMKERATQPFSSDKPQGEGTGLGLTIVSHVMTDHGGSMQLKNQPQGGCCVSLYLPLPEEQ